MDQELATIPFLNELGVELLSAENGVAKIALNVRERHTNSWKSAHGGVVMTLLDFAMARAGRTLEADWIGGVTIEMKTSFFRPAGGEGGRIEVVGHVVHRTPNLVFCEAEMRTAQGELVAKSNGTFKYRKKAPIPALLK